MTELGNASNTENRAEAPAAPEGTRPPRGRDRQTPVIIARRIRFEFEHEAFDLDVPDDEFGMLMTGLGISLTMPYLEPYLIRTMKQARPLIRDPRVAADAKLFSIQEGHHFRNHIVYNERLRSCFDDETANELRSIEEELEADYQRYTRTMPPRFNAGYAEGFEAMTCSLALASAECGIPTFPGVDLWKWHMAEEIEHRTVAFDVFDEIDGRYLYRLFRGTLSQRHYLSYVFRFGRCMATALGRELRRPKAPVVSAFYRRYFRTFLPSYDPARVDVPEAVQVMLDGYSAMVEPSASS